MLNIAEPVPPTEPIPFNSRNSVYHFQHNSGISGISSYQFLGIPGIPSDSGIEWSSSHPHPHTVAIASNSRTEFRELSRAGTGRNSGIEWSSCYHHPHTLTIASNSWTEFRELSRAGIGRNSVEFLEIPTDSGFTQFRSSGSELGLHYMGKRW
jgi:hypothetical protein